jgi:D-serine deaminase-like pyridoxal phosphate-dependent protein
VPVNQPTQGVRGTLYTLAGGRNDGYALPFNGWRIGSRGGQQMGSYTIDNVPTPALVIDVAKAFDNIDRLAAYGKQHNLGIRPHTKTHKSVLMAKRQMDAGAVGLTVAKVGEGEIMAAVNDDLLLAYPALDPQRTSRVAELAKRVTMRVAVDSRYAADHLAAAARAAGSTIGILVDLDVGMHRTGLQTPQLALELAQHVEKTNGLRLDGLFCYPGHVLDSVDKQTQTLAPVQAKLKETLDLWKAHGLAAGIVSAGSTPTAYQSHLVGVLTEIRPGTYIYNDRNYVAGGWCTLDQVAARLICTVVSDAVPDQVVLDAGSKTLTSDRLLVNPDTAGHGLLIDYPDAVIARISEEHGVTHFPKGANKPRLGERVNVVPNHICPCINLQNHVWLDHGQGELEKLPIDARGLLS